MFGKWKAWASFRFMKMADLEQNSHAIHNLHQQFLPSHRPSSGAYLLHSILHTAMVTHVHHKNVIIQASMDSVNGQLGNLPLENIPASSGPGRLLPHRVSRAAVPI